MCTVKVSVSFNILRLVRYHLSLHDYSEVAAYRQAANHDKQRYTQTVSTAAIAPPPAAAAAQCSRIKRRDQSRQ